MSRSQRFVARNRSPRVQIEYEVETYDAKSMVRLPFVVGVLADLAGKAEQPRIADRRFVEIDAETFDERMKSIGPMLKTSVPNALTGDGQIAIEMKFECMDDFLPSAVAKKVAVLRKLLTARKELSNLLRYLEGKQGAEELLSKALQDPELLHTICTTAQAKKAKKKPE